MCPSPDENRQRVLDGQRQLGLGVTDLWLQYVAVGGSESLGGIDRYLDSHGELPADEVARLAAALNEQFTDRGSDHPVRIDTRRSPADHPLHRTGDADPLG